MKTMYVDPSISFTVPEHPGKKSLGQSSCASKILKNSSGLSISSMELILRAGVGKPQYLFRLHLPLHAIKSVPFSRIIERRFNLETLFASSYSSYSSVWKKMSLHELASPKTVYFLILPAGDANMAVMMSTVWLYGKRAPTSSSRKPLKKRLNKHRTAPLSLVCQVSCATIRSSSSQTQTRPNPRVTCHRGQMDQSLLMSSWAELMLMQHEMLQPGVPNVQLRARCGKLHAHGARLNDYILLCLFRCIVPDRDVWETINNARKCDHAHIYDNVTKITLLRVIPTMTFIDLLLANLLAFYLPYLLAFDPAFYLAYLLAYILVYLLACLLAFYLAYLLEDVLAYLLFYLAFYLAYLLAYYLANLLGFYLAYLVAVYLIFYLAFYLAYLLAFYLAYLLAFYLVYLLAFYLAYLLAFYLAYLMEFYLAYLLAFHLTFYLAYLLAFYLPVEVQQCTLSWGGPRLRSSGAHCAGQIPGWGPAVHTGLGRSQVEVQRCTLSWDGPWLRSSGAHWAWGPAVHTELGRSQVEVPVHTELGSWQRAWRRELAKSLAKSWQGGSGGGSWCRHGRGETRGGGGGGRRRRTASRGGGGE